MSPQPDAILRMVANAFYDWEEPDPDATTREWCDRFNTYLRGCVVAQAEFTPEEWTTLRAYANDSHDDAIP